MKERERIRYVHLRLKSPTKSDCGALTLAIDTHTGYVGYAFCSPKDQFSRVRGRGTALWRLADKRCGTNPLRPWPEMVSDAIDMALIDGPCWVDRYNIVEPWSKPPSAWKDAKRRLRRFGRRMKAIVLPRAA